MARTKANNRRGPEGHQYRENMKTEEGRALNRDNTKNKKRKHRDAVNKFTSAAQDEDSESRPAKKPKNNKLPPTTQSTTTQATDSNPIDSFQRVSSKNIPQSSSDLSSLVGDLWETHDLTTMSIISSSQIQQKVKRVLEILAVYPTVPPAKSNVVMLHAKAVVASKMISIVEIAKREIGKNEGKWFQYSTVEQQLEEKEVRHNKGSTNDTNGKASGEVETTGLDEDPEDDGEGFETMKTPFERALEGKQKVRAVPIMAIYLSRVRIESLSNSHG